MKKKNASSTPLELRQTHLKYDTIQVILLRDIVKFSTHRRNTRISVDIQFTVICHCGIIRTWPTASSIL